MNETEFAEVLRYAQQRMRELGLAGLDDRIVADLRALPGPPSVQLDRYLGALETELRVRSEVTAARITRRLQRIVSTESGEPVNGIWVEFAPHDRELFGIDGIELAGDPDLDSLAFDIAALRAELSESRDSGT